MPKITRKKLTRGTKLTVEPVFNGLIAADAAIRAHTLDRDNLKHPYGTFRLNFNIPRIPVGMWALDKTTVGSGVFKGRVHLCLPFTLPPLQDEISAAGTLTETSTTYTLTEFGISFDQRAEPATIIGDMEAGNEFGGEIWSYDDVAGNKLIVSLVEKRMLSYDADAPIYPEREVASFTLDSVAFAGRTLRLNPFLMTGLSKEIHPYRSYMVMIRAPDAVQSFDPISIWNATGTEFISVNITLKFRTPLSARDTVAGVVVQNMPTVHNGAKTAATGAAVTPPIAASDVMADGGTGISSNLEILDARLGSRLEGGYLADGDVPVAEHIATDSCYEIIAVPMWQNFGAGGFLSTGDSPNAAWADHSGSAVHGPIIDWRRIPIDYPFVLHHVIAMSNYAAPASTTPSGGQHPKSSQLFQVGVLIGTGIRGDMLQYQNVAYLSWRPSSHTTSVTMDRLTNKADGMLGSHDPGEEHDYELISVPLVNTGGATPFGPRTMSAATLTSQGRPIFIGRGNTKTSARTSLSGATPALNGNEQFIEVRWAIDGNGNPINHVVPPLGSGSEILAGVGGNWVYLIGRKAIAADIAEIEPSAK